MTAKKKPTTAEAFMRLEERLAGMERELVLLREVITEPVPPEGLPKNVRRAVFKGTAESARKMRVAKAAKRNGMTRDAWVAQYGERETNP